MVSCVFFFFFFFEKITATIQQGTYYSSHSSSSPSSSVLLFSSNVIGGRVGRVVGTLLYGGSDFLEEEDAGKHPNKQMDSEQEKWSTFLSCRFLTLIKAKRAPHPPCRQTCVTFFELFFLLTTKKVTH